MSARPTPPRLSLFIVDDDVGFVHAAAELARDRGFDITVAGSVEQARARLAQASFAKDREKLAQEQMRIYR